jgi:glutamate N-acetyltransferase/amino-acid N-acetyltransferase
MSRKPRTSAAASKALEVAAKPVEVVGQTLERAFDPLTSALKRAALRRADRQARQFEPPAAGASPAAAAAPAGKTAGPVSPLAVPFPKIPPIAGVELATGRAGFYKQEREDLLVMRFPEGASCAGFFTRH